MHGRPAAVQDASFGQEKSADAHRPKAASGLGDPSQPAEERVIAHPAGTDAADDQHGIRTAAHVVIVSMREERQPALPVDFSVPRRGDDLDRVAGSSAAQQAVRGPEHLHRPDEVELVHRRHHEDDDGLPHGG